MKKKDINNRGFDEVKKMNVALERDILEGVREAEPITVSTAKAKFLECFRLATHGYEVIIQKRNSENASILSTSTITAMLDAMKFTVVKTENKGFNTVTVAVKEVPLYGEGVDEEAAIEDLIDSTIEFLEVYKDQIEVYSKVDSTERKVYMLKLLRCGNDRDAIRKAYYSDGNNAR